MHLPPRAAARRPRSPSRLALLCALAFGLVPARAGAQGPPPGRVQARRTLRAPVVDGALDDAAWSEAVPFAAFVQIFPDEGAAPGEPTEVRVLYDDETLYVGVLCRDSVPAAIVRKLGDRDAPPASDTVEVALDFTHDRRTAYLFGVNAGGVQYDKLLYGDNRSTLDWDGVWDAKVAVRPDGWSAELALPLRLFRFAALPEQSWGFLVRRHLARLHEDSTSALIPRNAKGYVSLFGELEGLRDLRPRHNVELLSYAAGRLVLRPQFSDPARPRPRLSDPSFDLGMDVRAAITPRLQLVATLNPDFGQVEADQIILNLTNQEVLFPEKRPFFFQGIEAFQQNGFDWEQPNQVLFYSRRIGLSTPILGAVKVSGEVGNFTVGLLDAFVTGARNEAVDEADPDRRWRYHARRPLHLGLRDEATLPVGGATENYFAGVLTYKLGDSSTVGLRAASAVPLPGECPAVPPAMVPSPCDVFGSNALALDWNLRTADARWVLLGQADVSRVVGGPPSRTLPDGVTIDRGQRGWGAYLQTGKVGGEPLRFDVTYSYVSPTLELNGAGYLPTQNEQAAIGSLHFIRPSGFDGLHSFDAWLSASQRWTTDGKLTERWGNAYLRLTALLPGFHTLGIEPGYEPVYYDVRELTGRGIPFQRTALYYFEVFGESDPARVLSGTLSYSWVGMRSTVATPRGSGYTFRASLVLRPQSRLESTLLVNIDTRPQGPRWTGRTTTTAAGMAEADAFLVGDLRADSLSVTFRQQFALLPRLTLQAYGQLFTANGRYLSFFRATPGSNGSVRFGDLAPTGETAPGFYSAGLKVNAVMRWEYRLGSTLYAIYSHGSESLLDPATLPPTTLAPRALGRGRAVDTFMVKWSYFWRL